MINLILYFYSFTIGSFSNWLDCYRYSIRLCSISSGFVDEKNSVFDGKSFEYGGSSLEAKFTVGIYSSSASSSSPSLPPLMTCLGPPPCTLLACSFSDGFLTILILLSNSYCTYSAEAVSPCNHS